MELELQQILLTSQRAYLLLLLGVPIAILYKLSNHLLHSMLLEHNWLDHLGKSKNEKKKVIPC